MFRPAESVQKEALAGALTELLWTVRVLVSLNSAFQCGGKRRAIVAVPGPNQCFEPPVK